MQTSLFAPKLAEHYDLRISAFYGLSGAPIYWDDIIILPGIDGTFGNDTLLPHAGTFFGGLRDGLVVTLMDVWVLNPAVCRQLNMACWCPVDHDPLPPAVADFFRQSGAVPIAMSRFGERQLAEFDPLYCPHAVDTSVYRPRSKAEAKKKMNVPDNAFVVGMVAANKGNPSRKSFTEALRAFSQLRAERPNSFLYLHTDIEGKLTGGVPLHDLIPACGIPEEAIRIADQYRIQHHPLSDDSMAWMYSALDVLLNPATGEGFGIPVLEAQACGTPAVVTDFSAMSEVCGAGWQVKGTPHFTPQRSWQQTPDVTDIAEALLAAADMPREGRRQLSHKARKHAEKYDVNTVMEEYMLPALAEAQARFDAREPMKIEARREVEAEAIAA